MNPIIGYISLSSSTDIMDELKYAIDNKFDYLGIALDWAQNQKLGDKKLSLIRSTSKKNNLKLSIHTHFYLPTSTMLPYIRHGLFKTIQQAVNIADKIGAKTVTVHPGYRESVGPSSDITLNSLVSNLTEMVRVAKRKNISICFENFCRDSFLLCYKLDEYRKVINQIKNIKVTLDIGHINTTNHNIIEYTDAVKEYIFDMHIHNNDGKGDHHKCLDEGTIDYEGFFRYCKSINYNGPFMLEVFPHENILKAKIQIEEIWKKISAPIVAADGENAAATQPAAHRPR